HSRALVRYRSHHFTHAVYRRTRSGSKHTYWLSSAANLGSSRPLSARLPVTGIGNPGGVQQRDAVRDDAHKCRICDLSPITGQMEPHSQKYPCAISCLNLLLSYRLSRLARITQGRRKVWGYKLHLVSTPLRLRRNQMRASLRRSSQASRP